MGILQTLTGYRFARLTVSNLSRTSRQGAFWNCQCDCGNMTVVAAASLKRGNTKSCGCLREEMRPRLNFKHGQAKKTVEYTAWLNMKVRCLNPKCDKFKFYGGRGITICRRWIESFETFFADVGPRPGPEYSLDRYPDNDGNYQPGNVRWATKDEQSVNRRKRTDFPARNNRGQFGAHNPAA